MLTTAVQQSHSVIHAAAAAKSRQSCPTLCDPTDGSPPGSSVPGFLQARILEWVAISFSTVIHIHILFHILFHYGLSQDI